MHILPLNSIDIVLSPTLTKLEFCYRVMISLGRRTFFSQGLAIAILLMSTIHEEFCYPEFAVKASGCGLKQSIAEGRSGEAHSPTPRLAL